MNYYERLQVIRRLNQQAPLKLIEALRAEGMWLKVTFHEDGRIDTVEKLDPVPAFFEPSPGVSILGPVPYQLVPVDPVPAFFEPSPGVSILGPVPYQLVPVDPGRVLQ